MSSSCSWSGPISTKTSTSILMSSSSISINGFSSSHWAWATGIQVFLLRICRADRFWHIGSQRLLIHLSTNSVHTIWKISSCHCLLMIQTITQPSSASYFSYFSVTNALNGMFSLTFGTWMYFVLPQEAILVSTFFFAWSEDLTLSSMWHLWESQTKSRRWKDKKELFEPRPKLTRYLSKRWEKME